MQLYKHPDTSETTQTQAHRRKALQLLTNVASHAQEMVISKITSGSTQEKSRSNAIYATIQALELLMWKNTSALTLERSPSNAISGQCNFSRKSFGHLWKHVVKKTRCTSRHITRQTGWRLPLEVLKHIKSTQALFAHFNTDNPNQTFSKGIHKDIFLDLQSVIGMAWSFGSIKEKHNLTLISKELEI